MNVLNVSMSLKKQEALFPEETEASTQKSCSWLKKGKNDGISNFKCSNGNCGRICVLAVLAFDMCGIATNFSCGLLCNHRIMVLD